MPNRASDLAWDEPDASTAAGLSRPRLIQAALDIADAEGLEAVSIRRVAAALDARPMSLYSHIASKDDLIALMLNAMSGQMLAPEPLPSGWRAALREIARRAYATYVAHPWMLSAFSKGTRVGPNMLRRAEQSATAVADLDLEPSDAWIALSVVHEWTMGHALHVVTLHEDDELRGRLQDADPSSFPRMSRVFGARDSRPSDATFELALEAVLDGVEARFAR
jgi:AcrR family transcriptional regulator